MNQTGNNINLFITDECTNNTNSSIINNGVWITKLNNPTDNYKQKHFVRQDKYQHIRELITGLIYSHYT